MVQLTLGRDVGSKCLCCAHKLLSAPPWHSPEEGSWLCPSPPATPVGFFWELLHSSSSDRQGGCSRMCQVRLHSFQTSRNLTGGLERKKKKSQPTTKNTQRTKGKKIIPNQKGQKLPQTTNKNKTPKTKAKTQPNQNNTTNK